jgi:hypothetical protein
VSIPDRQRQLRAWAEANAGTGNPIRDEFARSALSAVLRRLVLFGVEDVLKRYSARELLVFQSMCGGDFAILMARITCTRAMVEDDRDVLKAMADADLAVEQLAWHAALISADGPTAVGLLETITDTREELHVARLIVARRHPELVQAGWLEALPAELPLIGAHLCQLTLQRRPEYAGAVAQALVRQPAMLMAVEPDALLAPLVAASTFAPQHVLAPFEGRYGERTLVAAAEWHLEHGQPEPALQLCRQIRPLSLVADRARQVAVIAHLELKQSDLARSAAASILDENLADAAQVHIAEHQPQLISTDELAALTRRCPSNRPETLFKAITLLISRRELALVRALCHERKADFRDHGPLSQIFASVLGAAHG